MTDPKDSITLKEMKFSPVQPHGWIMQDYWSNGEYIVVAERVDYHFSIYVYSSFAKLIYILNSFRDLEKVLSKRKRDHYFLEQVEI